MKHGLLRNTTLVSSIKECKKNVMTPVLYPVGSGSILDPDTDYPD
jgi:hypothetical protein